MEVQIALSAEERITALESAVAALGDTTTLRAARTTTAAKAEQTVWFTSRVTVTTSAAATTKWVRFTADPSIIPSEATSVILGGQAVKAAAAGNEPRVLIRKGSGSLERQVLFLADSAISRDGAAITADAPCADSGFEYYVESGLLTLTLTVDGYRK